VSVTEGMMAAVESDNIQLDPFLNLEEELSEEWIEKAQEMIEEIPEQKVKYLEQLKEAIEKDAYLQQFSSAAKERNLTRFLRAGNWSITSAIELLKSYWTFGKDFPQCLKSSLPSKLGPVWEKKLVSCNPVRDNLGRRIVNLHRMGNWDPSVIPTSDFLACAYTVLDMVSKEPKTQIAGIVFVLNAEGFSFKHLRNFGTGEIKCLAAILNGAIPLWFRKFHIVNHPRVFGIFFGLIKPFLNERIRDNIIFHSDLTSLHNDVKLELLPPELGGEANVDVTSVHQATKEMEQELLQQIETSQSQKL